MFVITLKLVFPPGFKVMSFTAKSCNPVKNKNNPIKPAILLENIDVIEIYGFNKNYCSQSYINNNIILKKIAFYRNLIIIILK